MTFLQTLQAAVYLALAFGLFALGKIAFDTINPRFSVREELLERDNFAFAVTLVGDRWVVCSDLIRVRLALILYTSNRHTRSGFTNSKKHVRTGFDIDYI